MKYSYILCCCILLFSAASAQEKVRLRASYNEGDKFLYKMSCSSKTSREGVASLFTLMKFEFEFLVGKLNTRKQQEITLRYKNIAYLVSPDGKKFVFGYDSKFEHPIEIDSSKQANILMYDVFQEVFSGMIDQEFNIYIAEDGNLVNVLGVDKMVDNIVDNSVAIPGEFKPGLRTALKQSMNNEFMKKQMNAAFNTMPGKPVGVNDSFDADIEFAGGIIHGNYTVQKIDKKTVTLLAKGNISSGENDVDGTTGGTIVLDRSNGMTKLGDIKTIVNVRVNDRIISTETDVVISSEKI